MATTHACTVKFQLTSLLQNVGELQTAESAANYTYKKVMTTGSGADQSDQFWSDTSTAAGTTVAIDLANAATLNAFGEALSLTKLKGFAIKAGSSNTVDIEVTMPSGGVPWCKTAADAVLLKPDGLLVYVAPSAAAVAVSAGSTDLIHLTAASGTAAYDIVIWGVE